MGNTNYLNPILRRKTSTRPTMGQNKDGERRPQRNVVKAQASNKKKQKGGVGETFKGLQAGIILSGRVTAGAS